MCARCLELTRRSLLLGGGAAAAALHTGVANARIRPQDMVPLIGPGYKPTERDEIGLWKEMERVEEEVSGSNLLITDPKLTSYLQNLIGTVGGILQTFSTITGSTSPEQIIKLYAPAPGFYRLYAQTQIRDEPKFAPFNITVEK